MSAQSRIPLTFDVSDPKRLRTDLERQSATLENYHATLTGPQQSAVLVRKPVKRRLNDTTAAFGEFTPVKLVNATDLHSISLPRPDTRNAGLTAYVARLATPGTIQVTSPGATINGHDAVELAAEIGLYAFFFAGDDVYLAPAGSVWGIP